MIYIRTDMNQTIATGHVMRCLSIADAAKVAGEETTFILADTQAEKLIESRGHHVIILGTKWNDMDQELPIIESLIQTNQIKSILIDSYQVTKPYLARLSAHTRILYMDDLNAFMYPVNTLICYANYYKKYNYPAHYSATELYLGPRYAPLRKEFADRPPKIIKQKVENLLLMSGGSDPCGLLPKLLEALPPKSFRRIDVICGIYNSEYDNLQKKYASRQNIHIQKSVSNIENYMQEADLAVSAGGTTLYELCAIGTPTISYAIVDNQLDNVTAFQDQNIIDYAGDTRKNIDITITSILHLITKYQDKFALRAERSQKMQNLVDGQGAFRIAQILKQSYTKFP